MAREKIEDLSTEKLLKRKSLFTFVQGIYIGIFIVFLGFIIYSSIKNGNLDTSDIFSGIPIIGTIWIPIIFLREINVELKRREGK